jgi:hypothetical protein
MHRIGLRGLSVSLLLSLASFAAFATQQPPPSDQDTPIDADTQAETFYSAFDPIAKRDTTVIATTDGAWVTIVIDKATNAVYLSNASGATVKLSIPDLANAYSGGNPAQYAAFMDSIYRNLSASKGLEVIARPSGHTLNPPNGIAGPCDLQPCGVLQRRFIDGHLESIFRWNVENIDYSYEQWHTAQEIAEDREDFAQWRAEQCGASNSEFTEAFIAYLAAIPTCATAETGLSLMACTAAISSGIKDHSDSRAAERNCRMPYPGPRRWNRP